MAGADGVDIVLLHQNQIAQHVLLCDGSADKGIGIVAVDAAELDGLAVDADDHVIPDRNITEADGLHDVFSVAGKDERIQNGIFGVPELGIFNVAEDLILCRAGGDGAAAGGEQLPMHFARAFVGEIHLQLRRSVIGGESRMDKIILQAVFRAREDVHIAENARLTELVLILKVCAVAPLEHHDRQIVFTVDHIIGHVKFARAVRHLVVARQRAIYIHIAAGIHALEVKQVAHAFLLFDFKRALMQAAGIVMRHIGRIKGDGIADVGVLVMIVALHLPHGGHGDHIGAGGGGEDVLGQQLHGFKIAEAPVAGEQQQAGGSRAIVAQRAFSVGEGNVIRAGCARAHMGDIHILVVREAMHLCVHPFRQNFWYFFHYT